jgi:hypothetical protein
MPNTHTSPNPWLSPHRETLAALRAQVGPFPDQDQQDPAVAPLRRKIGSLEDRIKDLELDEKYDTGILTALGRKTRTHKLSEQLAELNAKLSRYAADLRARNERFDAYETKWWELGFEINREIELAAADEYAATRNGKHAPWLEVTLGPPPPARRRDLTTRWLAVAEYIHLLRVKRDVTDASASGVTQKDGALVRDILKLRWHTKQAIEQTPLERRFDPMEGEYRPGRIGLPAIPRAQ